MNSGLKLVKCLEEKGYKAKLCKANTDYRRHHAVMQFYPEFSHRYGAYVTGIAAPGLSGNAVTEAYGASVILDTVVTNAVLESDPLMDPRHFYDGRCKKCTVCKGACPPTMFKHDEEEYTLLNGLLYPRGKVRDINLCAASCAGLHSLSDDKKWSSWGKNWIDSWVGVKPDPEKQNIFKDMVIAFGTSIDVSARLQPIQQLYATPLKDGMLEDRKVMPNYEDLAGETEGQKLRSYADVLEKLVGYYIADPISQSCAHCANVCGESIEESQKRYMMLINNGIVCYDKGNELVITHDFDKAAQLMEEHGYEYPTGVRKEFLKLQIINFTKTLGINWHTIKHTKPYFKKLKKAVGEMKA